MACVNVITADTDEEAQYLATSLHQLALGLIRNKRRPMQPPVDDMSPLWSPDERAAVNQMFYYSFIGSPGTVGRELSTFVRNTGIDEVMVSTAIYDVASKIHSFELTASLFKRSASPAMQRT